MNISSRQLEAFLKVAELESFTEAAEKLHLTQPSLSSQIRQLEHTLRIKLFARTTRKVVLTEAGATFLPAAERTINRLNSALRDMHNLADGQTGRVSFAALLTVGASLIPAAMAEFQQKFPLITLEYIEESDEPIYKQVANGDIDFGISALPRPIEDINFTPIYKDYLYFVCSPRHPLAESKEVSWQQIVQSPFIAMQGGTSMRMLMERGFAMTDVMMEPVQTAVYQSTILGMVACDLGVSVLPSSLKLMFERNDVCLIPIKERLFRDIGLMVSKSRPLSKAAQTLVDVIYDVVGQNRNLLPRPD
ncbi:MULTISPECIES: LysR family transcriptional regulator [Vibrio]|uniref:LysR family transcriptional regulator n=2 Tax=Vibrio TaxID=662 RepID=A0A7X4RU79_9VIBR|nr:MULTISPECIES: LysR family transcriptional regulator [Vibrio]MBF9002818.1 LysR family transcriptional regulator [Vibrio nitrifigilis]MZI92962.1 LysR family transcriptional regulator [Vibrio eleionomae]